MATKRTHKKTTARKATSHRSTGGSTRKTSSTGMGVQKEKTYEQEEELGGRGYAVQEGSVEDVSKDAEEIEGKRDFKGPG